MKRSGLESNVLKKNAETNQIAHRKQRNYCVSLFRKEKKKFLESLDITKIYHNKQFWKNYETILL